MITTSFSECVTVQLLVVLEDPAPRVKLQIHPGCRVVSLCWLEVKVVHCIVTVAEPDARVTLEVSLT